VASLSDTLDLTFRGADPKRPPQHRADTPEWKELREHFKDACCVSCGLPAESLHHIVPRSQGGSDIVENLAPLCGDGTRGCHGKLEAHQPGWEQIAAHVRAPSTSSSAR
jgi:5-methylcytosine-specific restriction endonuclease McrA